MDESGDLGFDFAKRGTTKYFVITFVSVGDIKKFRKVIKKVKSISLGKKYKKMPEIKFSKSPVEIRVKILKNLLKTDFKFIYFVLNKSKIKQNLRNKKDKLFNYISGLLLEHLLKNYPKEMINLIVDKVKTKKLAVEDFDNYLDLKAFITDDRISLEVKHELSQNDLGLQATDFITGSIFQAYERENWKYYNIIKNRYLKGLVWPPK